MRSGTSRDIDKKDGKIIPAGRWTQQEQNLFEEAHSMYGKDWKKIKNHVGTRTGLQIRSHAQKYFKKRDKEKNIS